ncbi:TIGR02587 family membrane protein [Natronobiforma cellulositropha]|uniref:TIGR02587 family membrane protein n=1 Tax=Natronobiforma cellulositropha TaxID=1679076 RepID=UPI0021D56A37|nr:TIGR02587 family membrane protein [Natronobiforma cellulositropha]
MSRERPEETTVEDVLEQLETLERAVDDPEERAEVVEARRLVTRLSRGGLFGSVITSFTRKDKAEAFVGSVLIGLPLLVEDGVIEIGEFLAAHPPFFVANLVFATAVVIGILYVSKFQEVRITDPYFGVVPRRLVWVLAIAFVTATLLMTMWGRVTWDEPWVDLCRVSVIFTAMAIGGSLADILPGED